MGLTKASKDFIHINIKNFSLFPTDIQELQKVPIEIGLCKTTTVFAMASLSPYRVGALQSPYTEGSFQSTCGLHRASTEKELC